MDLELGGRVALVTGASQGIGLAVAKRLHEEGASLLVCARDGDRLQASVDSWKSGRAKVLVHPADVTRTGDLQAMHDVMLDRFGRIDILVNNAGTSARVPFLELTDERWQADLDLKVFAALRLCRLVLPVMAEAGWGRVVNVTAIAGKHPDAGSMPTSVSRAAGLAMTKALSKEFGRHGVLVNAVCIGLIRSAQLDREKTEDGIDLDDHYRRVAAQRQIPLGRVGVPEEVGAAVAFLCSSVASYITGASLNIDGGLAHVL